MLVDQRVEALLNSTTPALHLGWKLIDQPWYWIGIQTMRYTSLIFPTFSLIFPTCSLIFPTCSLIFPRVSLIFPTFSIFLFLLCWTNPIKSPPATPPQPSCPPARWGPPPGRPQRSAAPESWLPIGRAEPRKIGLYGDEYYIYIHYIIIYIYICVCVCIINIYIYVCVCVI